MPGLNEINESRNKKNFKKRDYRPWNLEGHSSANDLPLPSSAQEAPLYTPSEKVIEINCNEIKNWEYHDRPENELGDIEALANEFKEVGQLQACIVRPLANDSTYKYELIVGERRWRAAQLAGLPLKVIVKDLSDSDAGIIQASENYNRKDLSDFARGINYSRFIEDGIITPALLTKKLGVSKQQISRLLSFSKIPQEVINAIQDMSKISARTAEHIKQLCSKGEEYVQAVINCADKLKSGEFGHEKLSDYVDRYTHPSNIKASKANDKLYSRNGVHLFTLKNIGKPSPSLHFNKEIVELLERKNIDLKNVAYKISQLIEETIDNN